MKRLIILIIMFLCALILRGQDTIMVNQVLPDTIEIYDSSYTAVNYMLIVSETRHNNETILQARTIRIEIIPENLVIVDDRVYYVTTKKDKKL
jgi:hypothetical protein